MFVRLDADKNYMLLEIHNCCKWWDCNMVTNLFLHIIPYRCRLNNLIPDSVVGIEILKRKCACACSFKIIWKLVSKMSTTLRVRSSGIAFCRNYQRAKGCRS